MNPGISIWNRLLGVMVVMLAAVSVLFIWQGREADAARERLLRSTVAERQANFSRVNRLISRTLEAYAVEYSAFTLDQMPDEQRLSQSALEAQVDFVAILRPDLSPVKLMEFRGKAEPAELLPGRSALGYLAERDQQALFFSPSPTAPSQFAFTALAPVDGQPSGYLLAGRYWDRIFLTNLGDATQSEVQSLPVAMINQRPPGFTDEQRLYRAVEVGVGALGQPVFAYSITFNLSDQLSLIQQGQQTGRRIALGVLGVLVLFFAVLWKWLAYPVRLVAEALETDDPTVLKPILNEDYDWSRIAQRLTESSETRLALTRQVQRQEEQARIQEETARVRESLARDLHDGVIQSVYAVGLQLERVNTLLEKDPAKSRSRIDDCKNSLNGVIRELRGFIKGLTPEPLQGNSLRDALEQLVVLAQKGAEAKIDMQISPEACEALTTAQALNIYQLCRELLSNAIRHAQASSIRLRLTHESDTVVLRVSDNGVGFDPGNVREGGHGLVNLKERARQIGAIVKVSSNIPQGVVVHVTAPIIKALP